MQYLGQSNIVMSVRQYVSELNSLPFGLAGTPVKSLLDDSMPNKACDGENIVLH